MAPGRRAPDNQFLAARRVGPAHQPPGCGRRQRCQRPCLFQHVTSCQHYSFLSLSFDGPQARPIPTQRRSRVAGGESTAHNYMRGLRKKKPCTQSSALRPIFSIPPHTGRRLPPPFCAPPRRPSRPPSFPPAPSAPCGYHIGRQHFTPRRTHATGGGELATPLDHHTPMLELRSLPEVRRIHTPGTAAPSARPLLPSPPVGSPAP